MYTESVYDVRLYVYITGRQCRPFCPNTNNRLKNISIDVGYFLFLFLYFCAAVMHVMDGI